MTQRVVFLLVVAGLVPPAGPLSAATAAKPISVEVGFADRHRDFFDTLLSDEDTDRSDEEVERALRGRPWLEMVTRDGEVALAVTRRSVSESSRSRTKEGKVSVTWRYVVRAGISTRGERSRIEATTTSSATMSESEADRPRQEQYRDRDIFARLAGEVAEKANTWILAQIEELRPDRPDAGFRHEPKYKWLVKGDGLEVTEVLPGSPAARAGLEVGDRIRAIDGEKGTSQMDLRAKTWWIEAPGSRVTLEVERDKTRRPVVCEILSPRDWQARGAEGGARRASRASESASDAPPPPAVTRGMRAEDVERLLGKPAQVVSFPSKTVWVYEGLTVAFVDGRVTEVK